MNMRIFLAAAVMGLGTVGCVALPLPIQNGVLTGPLNANGQAVTNVGSVTFADGTTQSTAAGASGQATGIVTMVTNTFYVFSGAGTSIVNGNYYYAAAGFTNSGGCFFTTNGLPTAVVYQASNGTMYYATTNGMLGTWGNVWYSGGNPVGTTGAGPAPTVTIGQSVSVNLNVTNIQTQTLTFGDGTSQSTAGGGNAGISGFSGTVTNLTETLVTTTGPNLIPPGTQYGATGCGLDGVVLPFDLQANVSYLLILGPNELGPPGGPGGPVYPGVYILDGGCLNQGQLSATNVLNFANVENPYTVGFGSYNFSGPVTFTLQQITTNVVRSFNLTTFSNGVAQTNSGLGDAWDATPAAAPAGVQYGGPMMFDYFMGCTNILSDGMGDVLIQDGGSLVVDGADSRGFGYLGGPITTIGSGLIVCSGWTGYQGPLTDSRGFQGIAGQQAVANGDGSWTWGGPGWGASFYAPGCYSVSITEYGGNSMFGPNCWGITDYGGNSLFAPDCNGVLDNAGWCFFGPACQSMSANGPNSFFGPGCNNLADAGNSLFCPVCNNLSENVGYSFYSPGCNDITDSGGYSVFGPACTGITAEGGHDFFGPGCGPITESGYGYSFYAANCFNITDSGGGNSFFGPGCLNLTNNSGYGAYFGTSGSVAASTGVLVVGDNATPVNLTNETSLVVADGYQLGLAANNVRLTTDGTRIIPTAPVTLTNGVTTVEGNTFYPHTVGGALVWTTSR